MFAVASVFVSGMIVGAALAVAVIRWALADAKARQEAADA